MGTSVIPVGAKNEQMNGNAIRCSICVVFECYVLYFSFENGSQIILGAINRRAVLVVADEFLPGRMKDDCT
jgi:hypothetical protein